MVTSHRQEKKLLDPVAAPFAPNVDTNKSNEEENLNAAQRNDTKSKENVTLTKKENDNNNFNYNWIS